MFASGFMRWFSRAAECYEPADCPHVVGPAQCPVAHRATPRAFAEGGLADSPSPLGAVPVLTVAISQTADDMVIRVKGEATVECAGPLVDGLLAPTAHHPAVVTLDLSELLCISTLAMAGLETFRRGVVRTGGRVRLAKGLKPAVNEALIRAELFDLFETTGAGDEGPRRTKAEG